MPDSPCLTAAQIEEGVRQLGESAPETAVRELTAVLHRTVVELQKVARAQANAHRGEPDWGRWARVANAARSSVLAVAAVRDAVKGLGPAGRAPESDQPLAVEPTHAC